MEEVKQHPATRSLVSRIVGAVIHNAAPDMGYGLWNHDKNRWMRPMDVTTEQCALTYRTREDAEIGQFYHVARWGIKCEVRPFDWNKEQNDAER